MNKPVLVFGYGNPSRGDDALGPMMIKRLEPLTQAGNALEHVELLTDFQLQVEHAMDMAGRRSVIFVDACASGDTSFMLTDLQADNDTSLTTHAMSPAAVLHVYTSLYPTKPRPDCRLLSIRGYMFELGQPLSAPAADNLEAACQALVKYLIGIRC